MHKNRILKREEQQLFINSFSQAKNLIDKQMKIGFRIRQKTHERKEKQERVRSMRAEKASGKSQIQGEVLKSVLYDNNLYEYNSQN